MSAALSRSDGPRATAAHVAVLSVLLGLTLKVSPNSTHARTIKGNTREARARAKACNHSLCMVSQAQSPSALHAGMHHIAMLTKPVAFAAAVTSCF
jgi:hypothetical protein